MSEMFNMMYDEIFLKENRMNTMDNEHINEVTKKYIGSKAILEDKKKFLQLKKMYLKVINIKDYRIIQNQLYQNMDRNDVISFELVRILEKASDDSFVLEQVSNVKKILSLYDEDMSDDLYFKIINGIIELELSLGMNVGLFRELCLLFENKVEEIDAKLNGDLGSYKRK